MFRAILKAAGIRQADVAAHEGLSRQNFNAKLNGGTIAVLFFLLNAIHAKLVVEFANGERLNLMPFADEYRVMKRPELADGKWHCRCKEG